MKTYTTPAGNTDPRPFKINDTVFKGVPSVPATKLPELFIALCGDAKGQIQWDDHLLPFFRTVMESKEVTRFESFIKDEDNIVRLDLLYTIAQDLYEDYAGRPFKEHYSSLESRLTDGQRSADGSPSKEEASTP